MRTEAHSAGATRRDVLRAAALAATLPIGSAALARAPMLGTQAPYFYRFPFGQAEVSIVSDGPLPLGNPGENFTGVSREEVARMLQSHFLATDNVILEQNIPIVNFGERLVLFDTGMGTNRMFGPSTGRLLRSMREAGIDPASIDAVVCSHAHIDHVGGISGDNGQLVFPNAQVYISQADFDFWTDESKLGTPLRAFVEAARKNLMPVRDRIVFVRDGQEFLPGVTAIGAPGHTVGHTIFNVASGNRNFAFIGDLTHHQVLLLERPRMEFAYDSDPKQSAETRVRLLGMLAANRTPIMSFHFPWPGFGYVAQAGEGFRYYPEPMQMHRG